MSELRPVATTARGAWNKHMLASTQSAFEAVFKAVSEGHTVLRVVVAHSVPVITVEHTKLCETIKNVSRSHSGPFNRPRSAQKTLCTAKYGAAKIQWMED